MKSKIRWGGYKCACLQNEIGSSYWLDSEDIVDLPRKSKKTPTVFDGASYVSTCRSAIGICLDTLPDNSKIALLPAFTCESVLVSFIDRGYKVFPYPIRRDLSIDWAKFSSAIDNTRPNVVLVHSYFGFDTIGEIRNQIIELREQGIIVIEDETQSMFSNCPLEHANFYVGSIRKWLPVPDGAFCSAPFNGDKEDIELIEAKIAALIEKGNWMLTDVGSKAEFQQKFRAAEGILDSRKAPYKMASFSREIFSMTDVQTMKQTRRNNCNVLMTNILLDEVLSDKLILPVKDVGKDDCPFHLPVLVKEGRKELQRHLASRDIFATVIWGCPDEYKNTIDEDSEYVYDHILCFHVDQRYDESDMKRIINVLKEYYQGN